MSMNNHIVTLFLAALCLSLLSCSLFQRDIPPKHLAIEQAYFKCEQCHALEGGIYGQGPFKRFRSPGGSQCIRDWQRILRDEFKRLASQWHGMDWGGEISFWQTNVREQ